MIRCPSCGATPSAAELCHRDTWECGYLGKLELERLDGWADGVPCRWCGGATSEECVCEDRP